MSVPLEPVETPAGLGGRQQGIRYLLVGGWNTLFAFLAFAALNAAFGDDVNYMFLLPAATVLAILNAYIGYRTFVFKVKGHWWRDLGRFSLVYAGAFVANLTILPFLVEIVGLPVLVAQGIVTGGTVIVSFFGHRSFSFSR
jgi:putative flippase GtrA